MLIFVYGTLRDPSVLNAVLGHDRAEATPAWIENHAAKLAQGYHFPMLRPEAGNRAEGLLLTNLNAADIAALDAFEGETYQRQAMAITTADDKITAYVYIDDGRYQMGEAFDLAQWETEMKGGFITHFMEGRGFERPS